MPWYTVEETIQRQGDWNVRVDIPCKNCSLSWEGPENTPFSVMVRSTHKYVKFS